MLFKPSLNEWLTQLESDEAAASEADLQAIMNYAVNIEKDIPFCRISNFRQARQRLAEAPFWLAYGGVRTGSTFSFTLLRTLMDSLSDRHLAAWEGDFQGPEVFFNLVRQSRCLEAGILKIHRVEPVCAEQLQHGKARAIVTIRDYPAIAVSLWRMQHNPCSGFYEANPSEARLLELLTSEMIAERYKRELPNCLFVREDDIRLRPIETIDTVARFLDIAIDRHCLERVQTAVSLQAHIRQQGSVRPNHFGHDGVSLLHPFHVDARQDREASRKASEARPIIELVWRELGHELQEDGYLR